MSRLTENEIISYNKCKCRAFEEDWSCQGQNDEVQTSASIPRITRDKLLKIDFLILRGGQTSPNQKPKMQSGEVRPPALAGGLTSKYLMKVFAQSKKAGFNYQILEKFEAGVILNGQEVKSVKTRGLSLDGTYVIVKPDGVFWVGGVIPPYQPGNAPLDWRNERTRKLLLRKSEIKYLTGKTAQKGLTLVPLKLYTNNHNEGSGKIKLEFGVAKGKKLFDKRDSIKKREVNREIDRALKEFNK